MKKESLRTKPSIPKDKKILKPSFLTFDLPKLIDKIKHKNTWEIGELNSMILLKNRDKQIVLTALHEGTVIKSFQSNDSVTFQIIEGELKFNTPKTSVTLDKGQLLTLNENINYSLTTTEETVFLLTIANSALQPAEN